MNNYLKWPIAFITLLFYSMNNFAQGTKTLGVSTRAESMGGAFTGVSDDASAAFYNPAGLVQINDIGIEGDFFPILPDITYTNAYNGMSASSKLVSYGMSTFFAKRVNENIVLGIDLVAPFARKMNFPEPGALLGFPLISKIIDMNLTPVMAVKLTDKLSFGAGPTLNYDYASATVAGFKQKASGFAVSGVFSTLYKISNSLKLGAAYHLPASVSIDGHSNSRGIPIDINQPLTIKYRNPGYLNVGVGIQATEKLLFAVDYEILFWQQVKNFRIIYNSFPALNNIIILNPRNSSNIHAGLEYAFKDNHKIRLGYVYSEQSMPDAAVTPVTLDFKGNVYTAGYSYFYDKKWRFDLGYELAAAKDTVNSLPIYNFFQGRYQATVSTILLGVNYQV